MRVLSNFYYVTNIFDLHICNNEMATLFFFVNLHGYAFRFFIVFQNESNITTSPLMIHLKCTVVHYADLNSSCKNKPILNYGSSNMLFRFSQFVIHVYFNETFVKKTYEIAIIFWYKFPKFISRCSILQNIRMSNLVILKCDTNAKFEKMAPFLKRYFQHIF